MPKNSGLLKKISRAFLLQAGLISIAVMLSVFVAKIVLEEVLIKEAIEQEAEYFWENYQRDKNFSLPDTLNLTGYLADDNLPDGIRKLSDEVPGFYEYDDDLERLVVHVSSQDKQTLYLLYNRGQVDSLAAYYGLFPLALVLILLYLSLWLSYTFSRRALSPFTQLARQVNQIDFNSPDFSLDQTEQKSFESNHEIKVLTDAIDNLGERLNAFISRERNFTRDASHELRSPLTVIKIAADMLESEQELSVPAQNTVNRIRRAATDMEELTQAFLLLARESDQALTSDMVSVNDVIKEEIERAELLNPDKQLTINYQPEFELRTRASDKVLSVLIGNLIRNAFLYTDGGSIDISVRTDNIIISDSGKGIPPHQVDNMFKPYRRGENTNVAGYGVGLTIVKRLSDRFNWPITIKSEPGVGTSVAVQFPESESRLL